MFTANSLLLIATNGCLEALDSHSGNVVWRLALHPYVLCRTVPRGCTLIAKEDIVFVGWGGCVFAVDLLSGRLLWRRRLRGPLNQEVVLTLVEAVV